MRRDRAGLVGPHPDSTPAEPWRGLRQTALVEVPFGPSQSWRPSDLVAVSRGFDADLALQAYRHGVFPMPVRRSVMGWFSPLERGVLPLEELRVSRSLRRMLPRYRITVDTAFDQVLRACADPERPGSWIDDRIKRVYEELHRRGIVHSIEAWTEDDRLAGGLYGVSIGGLFAGESMFHEPYGRDASKVALVALVGKLREAGGTARLLDVQWQTPHLQSLGVVEIPRKEYLCRLEEALPLPEPDWTTI